MFTRISLPDSGGIEPEIKTPALVSAPGALKRWIGAKPLKTSLKLIYSASLPENIDSFGWQDRRLICEYLILKSPLPEDVVASILEIPQILGDGPWLIAASPYFSALTGQFWMAGGSCGILDAIKLVWADYVSSAFEQKIGFSEIDSGIIVIPESSAQVSLPSADPSSVQFDDLPSSLKKLVYSESPPEDLLFRTYAFGRLYNRLIQPSDPFEYLRLLSGDSNSHEMRKWRNAATGSGHSDEIRLTAASDMKDLMSRKNPSGPSNPTDRAENYQIRQISGSASSPGIAEAEIWNPTASDHDVPEKRYILAVSRLDEETERYLPGAAGLLEQYGGRGGAGAFRARQLGIPAICEASELFQLPVRTDLILNGDNGIITVKSVH